MESLFTSLREVQLITWEFSRITEKSLIQIAGDGKTVIHNNHHTHTSIKQVNKDNNESLKIINEIIAKIIEDIDLLEKNSTRLSDEELLSYEKSKQKIKTIANYIAERADLVDRGLQNLEKICQNISDQELKENYFESISRTKNLYSLLEKRVQKIEQAIEKITEPLREKIELLVTSHLCPALTGQISEDEANKLPPLENKITRSTEKNYKTALHFAISSYIETALKGAYSHHYTATSQTMHPLMDVTSEVIYGYKIKSNMERTLKARGGIYLIRRLDSLGAANDDKIKNKLFNNYNDFVGSCSNQELAVAHHILITRLKEKHKELNPYSLIFDFKHLFSCNCFSSNIINYVKTIKKQLIKDFPKIDFNSGDYEFKNLINRAIIFFANIRKNEVAITKYVREKFVGAVV